MYNAKYNAAIHKFCIYIASGSVRLLFISCNMVLKKKKKNYSTEIVSSIYGV